MRLRKRPEPSSDIDISPLIDMVFILLIFFMVSTTFVKDMKLDLERPSARSSVSASSKALRVHLDRAGAIWLEDAPVKPWMLQSRIRELLGQATTRSVLVVTDRNVPAERLIEVVDQCRLGGADDVGVATVEEAG
ncbi:MAG: biopolymer transporter ExbD [Deltaproteobacteria bacterium]|nr:biopolymer transporter ExbD [Deltaproteobacteria bacterium]MCB9785527.1 biopolymer transporter ExbD [Deltaproteobacteria bacterium]